MNNKIVYLFIIILLCALPSIQNIQAQSKQDKKEVNIGIVIDGKLGHFDKLLDNLKKELTILLGSKFSIHIHENKILSANWSAENVGSNYDRLVEDKHVDIVLGIGILTSYVIAKKGTYPKPVIALGIFDPTLINLTPTLENSSGIHNFTYFLFNKSIERDLDVFYSVYPYTHVGIVFSSELHKLIPPTSDALQKILKNPDTTFTLIPITTSIDDVLSSLDGIDAVYLNPLGKFDNKEKSHLIEALNLKNIPTFGWSVADVKLGVMAAITPEENFMKIFRRISLDVEAILNGEDPADLPVYISFEERLTLNMHTAREIDFSPKFSILSEAELINEFVETSDRVLNLDDVLHEAIKSNLDLKIEEGNVQSAHKEVSLARANFSPSFALSAVGVHIDEDRASGSFGQQAEQTISGTASLEQLIFSEQAMSNLAIQKHQLRASEYGYAQQKLDIIMDAAFNYFNILKAKTLLKVRTEDVALTKRNLEISKLRQTVGYSGQSDVYRWESRLASATTDLLSAKNNVRLSKIKLNQLLNRPLNEDFIVQEIVLEETSLIESPYSTYLRAAKEYVDNPKSLEIYTDFLIQEAIDNSPEIRQLNAHIASLERKLASFKKERFVPTVGLGAQADHVFSRSGAGSSVPGVDPEDDTWNVSINFNLPLFQGGAVNTNIQKTKIEINTLNNQKNQLLQFIELNVHNAVLDLSEKRVNLQSSRKSADFANKSLDIVQDLYAKGRMSIVDLTEAQNASLNADLAALNSEHEFTLSVLRAERAVGKFTILNTPQEQEAFSQRLKAHFNKQVH
ncbi:MAG: ABC transporter substrate binding protein [bacterium]